MLRHRWLIALAAIATALVLVSGDAANARAGGGFSGGSRGMRTFSMPAPTRTAPSASPVQRSATSPASGASSPYRSGYRPGFFGGGLFGSLAAGFLGAGLFGLLFGHGLFGGMLGFGSVLGLVLQLVLIYFAVKLFFAWLQRRNMPASAYASGGGTSYGFSPSGGGFGAGAGAGAGAAAPASTPITIDKADYDAFERLLGDIQEAYSAEDISALRARVTPEMLSYFNEQLSQNASRGLVDRVSDVRLMQGDLSEAWREGDKEYASVAMRYSLVDRYVDRATGKAADGNDAPQEATEVWTFTRARGGNWLLSAIQQA